LFDLSTSVWASTITPVPSWFHFIWTLSPLKKVFCDTGAAKLGTRNSLTAAGWPLRSGTKQATEWFFPGDTVKSVTPSRWSLFHTVRRSPLS
jgi:hypothetical protein